MFGSNMDKPNYWVDNFKPTVGFVHIWPKHVLIHPSIF